MLLPQKVMRNFSWYRFGSHLIGEKESSCGCAGCFSAPYALAKYAEVFSAEGKLENLENFASLNGAKFYGLPVNKKN